MPGLASRFIAYTDESCPTAERFRSLAAISVEEQTKRGLERQVEAVLAAHRVGELKWSKVSDDRRRKCAEAVLVTVVDNLATCGVQVVVLVWDTHDARHAVLDRDDHKNFERMFFHLLSHAMKRRTRGARWIVVPDQKSDIDWETVRRCVAAIGRREKTTGYPLLSEEHSEALYSIDEFREGDSSAEPLIQVADLLAGMAAFSRRHAAEIKQWLISNSQPSLFQDAAEETSRRTNRERARFLLLDAFSALCRARRLGVSLRTNGYLCNLGPSELINFWHYTPQHDNDRAPTRGGN